jgi:hypothetical protein
LGETWESIIDRLPELLLEPEMPFGRSHRRMTKEKLDLLKFSAKLMAEARTAATQIVRRQVADARVLCTPLHDIPDDVHRDGPIAPESVSSGNHATP